MTSPARKQKKIVIIKMSALGDVMISLPHIETLLSHHSGEQVWIITSPQFAPFFANDPRLRVVVLDRKKRFSSHGTLARIIWVARQKFDYLYDLQGNRTSRLLVRFSGAKVRVGTQPRPIYTHHPAIEYTRESRQNVFERLNETLLSGGVAAASPGCSVKISPHDEQLVTRWQQTHGLVAGGYALLHAGGSDEWGSKRWPKENYLELGNRLEKAGVRSVWIGGPDDAEINKYLASGVGINATGEFSVLQLYRLGCAARFGVTNDSGPMHILSAAGIPIYSFFGPTDWIRSHTAGQAERVFHRDIPCSPCFKRICPADHQHQCMKEIHVDTVMDKIAAEMFPPTDDIRGEL